MKGIRKTFSVLCVLLLLYVIPQTVLGGGMPMTPTADSFTVASCFGDNMVFQQNEPIRIWGSSTDEGAVIAATLGESVGSSKVINGEWTIELAPRVFNPEPQVLEIYGNEDSRYVSFENITIGDVWMFIGQSNIEYTTSAAPEFETFSSSILGDEKIRILHVPLEGFTNNTRWRSFTRYGIYNASALGTFFAKNVSDAVKNEIPIGLVSLGYKGKPISSFLPGEESNDVYNNIIKYIEKMPVAGIVWYQGEADAAAYDDYSDKLALFIRHQREIKNQEKYDFPFYVIELPPCFNDENDPLRQYINFGEVRASTGFLTTQIKNFYICTTSDLWNNRAYSNNLHPNNKKAIADRLSLMVLASEYGFGGVDVFFSPTLKSISYGNSKKEVIAEFDHTGTGLSSHGVLKGFTLINKNWDKIDSFTCEIENDTLYFCADDDICIIKYASETDNAFADRATLFSGSGMPAAAFSATLEKPPAAIDTIGLSHSFWLRLLAGVGIVLVLLTAIYFMIRFHYRLLRGRKLSKKGE